MWGLRYPSFFHSKNPLHWISVAAIALAFLDTFIVSISLTALGLLAIAALPWVLHLFRSIELPGGLKFEMNDLTRAGADLLEASPSTTQAKVDEPAYMQVVDKDPNLALAGLRIEIEKQLRRMANGYDINRSVPIPILLRELLKAGAISGQQYGALNDLLPMLNAAVHGADVPQDSYPWAMQQGPLIVNALKSIHKSDEDFQTDLRRNSSID